jgi:hypothetical protein
VKGQTKTYYSLDTASIEKYQAAGLLPSPLPAYELSPINDFSRPVLLRRTHAAVVAKAVKGQTIISR